MLSLSASIPVLDNRYNLFLHFPSSSDCLNVRTANLCSRHKYYRERRPFVLRHACGAVDGLLGNSLFPNLVLYMKHLGGES